MSAPVISRSIISGVDRPPDSAGWASRSPANLAYTPPTMDLAALSAARWRIAILLTLAMMAVYFGFILLVAFNKPLLGRLIAPGLSLGVLLGVLVIITAWILIW